MTDLKVGVGINHVKLGWKMTDVAVERLVEYFRVTKLSLPELRLYYVEVPPSLSRGTSLRSCLMNRWMEDPCAEMGINVVRVPKALITEDGTYCLRPEMAVAWKMGAGVPDISKLHYNDAARALYANNIGVTMRVASRSKM